MDELPKNVLGLAGEWVREGTSLRFEAAMRIRDGLPPLLVVAKLYLTQHGSVAWIGITHDAVAVDTYGLTLEECETRIREKLGTLVRMYQTLTPVVGIETMVPPPVAPSNLTP